MATKQEIIDRLSQCGGLSYQDWINLLDSIYFDGDITDAFIDVESNALPTPSDSLTFGITPFLSSGAYTWNGNTYTIPQDHYGYFKWDGSTWSLIDMGELPDKSAKPWVAQAYTAGSFVYYVGKLWESVDDTTSTDTPSMSPKWKEVLTGFKSAFSIESNLQSPASFVQSFSNLKKTIKSITLFGDWYNKLLSINSFSYNSANNTLSVYISESSSESEVINPSNPKIRMFGSKVLTPEELTKDVQIFLTPIDGTIYGNMTVNLSSWVLSDTNIANGVGGYVYKNREVLKSAVIDGNADIDKTEKPNLWSDPYFTKMFKWGHIYDSISSYNNMFNGALSKQSDGNWIYLQGSVANVNTSIRIPLNKLGLKEGDNVSVTVSAKSSDSRGRIFIAFYNSSGALVGSVKYSNHPVSLTPEQVLWVYDLIPSGAFYLNISFERTVGLGDIFFSKMSINKGIYLANIQQNKIYLKPFEVSDRKYVNDIISILDAKTPITNFTAIQGVGGLYNDVTFAGLPCYGIKITGANTAPMRFDTIARNLSVGHTIGFLVYIKNASNVTDINLEVYSNGTSETWNRSASNTGFGTPLVEGWNLVRINITDSTLTNFGVNSERLRLIVYAAGSCEVFIGSIFIEKSEKAKLLFVNDHGRKDGWINLQPEQTTTGVQDAEARNMPIIFALNPGHVDNNDPLRMNLSELQALSASKIARWSFHSYNTPVTASMPLEELKLDIRRSIDWLMAKGFGKPTFRGAITQNEAVNGRLTMNYYGLNALPSSTGSSASQPLAYPFTNRNNISRLGIHGRSNSFIDTRFDLLKKTKGALICYTHGIGLPADTTSVTVSEWNYFLSKIDTGLSEGWLDLVGYEELEQSLALLKINDNDRSIKEVIIEKLRYIVSN